MIQTFSVSRDDSIYSAFPDLAMTASGRLVCVFADCTHHGRRDFTCMMVSTSDDQGRTWSPKMPFTEPLRGNPQRDPYWNCPRVSRVRDGRLVAVVDRIAGRDEGIGGEQSNWLWFSSDEGDSWQGPVATPVVGIVPDQLIELTEGPHAGRWLLAAHTVYADEGKRGWFEQVWLSDDQGATWDGPNLVAHDPQLRLCEGSILQLPGGALVCFLRENTGIGDDAYKTVSLDGGRSWSGLTQFPLPACHRPVAGMLPSGEVFITYRHMQGGKGWVGRWTQNLFGALTDVKSCLATTRGEAWARIMPIAYDRSPQSDIGYSGWVAWPDGRIYVVTYLLDDAPKAQIRGYAFHRQDIMLG